MLWVVPTTSSHGDVLVRSALSRPPRCPRSNDGQYCTGGNSPLSIPAASLKPDYHARRDYKPAGRPQTCREDVFARPDRHPRPAKAHRCFGPVAFAVYTGMRLGEIMPLRWKDIREAQGARTNWRLGPQLRQGRAWQGAKVVSNSTLPDRMPLRCFDRPNADLTG